MSVLVGIPTHRRPDLLRQCLDSIAAQAGDLPPVRVFVADNDAKGQEGIGVVEEIATAYRFPISGTVVPEPGISAVRNAILAEARLGGDEFIAWLDDDMQADQHWLANMLEQIRLTGANAASCPVFYENVPDDLKIAFWTNPQPSGPVPSLYGTGGSVVSASYLREVNSPTFHPMFGLTGGEDSEWFARLKNLGARFAWSAEAKAYEHVPSDRATLRWVAARQYRTGVTETRIALCHRNWRYLARLMAGGLGRAALLPAMAIWHWHHGRSVETLKRVSRIAGRFAALLGFSYSEYADRHPGSPENQSVK